MCDEMLTTAMLVKIKRNNNSDNIKLECIEQVDNIDKNAIISIHYKDDIVKINSHQFDKLLTREVLKVVFKNESDNVTKHLNRLMAVNSSSIIDNVMACIRNDTPLPKRYTVDFGTLFDPQVTSRIISVHTAMKNNVPMPIKDENRKNTMQIAIPIKSAQRNMQIQIHYNRLPSFPAVPPYCSLSTWKPIPSAPPLIVEPRNGKLRLTWNIQSRNEVAKIKFYELYYCQEAKVVTENSKWEKFADIDAKELSMTLEIDTPANKGGVHYYVLRAVDVHERRGPFTIHKLCL